MHNPQEQQVSRRAVVRDAGAAVAATAVGVTASPAAAYHEGQTLEGSEGFFGGGSVVAQDDPVSTALAGASGLSQRARFWLAELGDAGEIAAEIQNHINTNSEDYLTFVNHRNLGGDGYEVLALTITQDDESVPLFLVAEFDTDADAYQSLELLSEQAYTDAHGDRDHDEAAVLSGHAAAEAPDDLDRLHEEFIRPNEDITAAFGAEMAAKYGESNHVSSTLLGDDL